MQAGISTASLFMRENNEDALPTLDKMGVKVAEVFLTSFCEYEPSFSKLLANRKGKVDVFSVHTLTSQIEPQLLNAHPRVREDAYEWLKKVMQGANLMGATHYTFHGMTRMKRYARSGDKDNFPKMIEDFRRLSDFCQNYGVHLCLENVEWSTYNRLGVFEKLSKEIPQLLGVLDVKQARISEVPYHKYLEEMGERLSYVHISDVDRQGKMCLPGRGIFDFDELIKRLQDIGFDGKFFIEAYHQDYQEISELKDSLEYVNELLYKHNAL